MIEQLRTAQHAVAQSLAEAASREQAACGVVATVADVLGWTCGEYWQVGPGGEAPFIRRPNPSSAGSKVGSPGVDRCSVKVGTRAMDGADGAEKLERRMGHA
ncbi:hypothetical protein [Planomonospora algeriensis]